MNLLPLRLGIVLCTVADLPFRCVVVLFSELVFQAQAIRASLARRCETLRARRDEEETQ